MGKYFIMAMTASIVSYLAMGVCVIIRDAAKISNETDNRLQDASFILGSASILMFVVAAAIVLFSKNL